MWNGAGGEGRGEDRRPGPSRVRRRVLWALSFALAGAAGCGDSGEAPASPPLLPPPEPPPSRVSTLFLGFVEDRIEIVEGEGAAVDIAFEPQYWGTSDRSEDFWLLDVRAVVEAGSASAGDLVVGGVRIGPGDRKLESGTTWLGLRALADGVAEAPETLRLRLEPVANRFAPPSYPEVIEVTNAELEVVIRDAEAADICADVRITATKPRFVPRGGGVVNCPLLQVFETEVTVESERGTELQLDRLGSRGRIYGWRVEPLGSRVRHEFLVQWKVLEERSWETRLEPCPGTGRGPTLVCTWDSCRVYGRGSVVPAPRRPEAAPRSACR